MATFDRTERVPEPFSSVAKELVDILGGPAVALIGGVNKTSTVGGWVRGLVDPKSDRERRVRLGLRIARTIKERFGDKTVRAWFWGANSRLEDETPIAILATKTLDRYEKELLGAARSVIQI